MLGLLRVGKVLVAVGNQEASPDALPDMAPSAETKSGMVFSRQKSV